MEHYLWCIRSAFFLSSAFCLLPSFPSCPLSLSSLRLFRYYDRDNSGHISLNEFISLMRRDGRATRFQMSNVILQEIFTEHVDSDRSGEVSHDEFADWLQEQRDDEEAHEARRKQVVGAVL